MADNTTELTEQVREALAEVFGIDESEIADDISQSNYSRWTSLSHMTLLATLEEKFDLTFSMDEMSAMTSLPKIMAVLKQHAVKVL